MDREREREVIVTKGRGNGAVDQVVEAAIRLGEEVKKKKERKKERGVCCVVLGWVCKLKA